MTAKSWPLVSLVFAFVLLNSAIRAEDAGPTDEEIRAAVTKSLPLLVSGAKGSLEHRKNCFTCHNQGLPVMALLTAKSRGWEVDDDHVQTQLKFIADFLKKNQAKYLEGKGQGGQVDMAGFALWTLDLGDWKRDETTRAVAEYFLLYQNDQDYYRPSSRRPPSEQSLFTSSYVALRGLKNFGENEQQERINARTKQVRDWLLKTKPEDTEDRVFRLRALQIAGATAAEVQAARDELLKTQREDGGFAQLTELESDAYATATALVALHESAGVNTTDAAYRRGMRFLLKSQLEDGSWHVVSRAKPFQKYFESGYPHGKDQFISIAAGAWATTALILAVPEKK